jgi:hypothetical protein
VTDRQDGGVSRDTSVQAGSPILAVDADRQLRATLGQLAEGARLIFLAGLPGTGKSLIANQIVHLARAAGRTVHLLQWDVARPVFEATPAGRRYPLDDGVTHPLIRKAAGVWARRAVAAWDRRQPSGHLLVGETPLVGNRFIELARPENDEAERSLRAPTCCFAVPVPSREVRALIEAERERRAVAPVHPREREDAPPHVLRALWHELAAAAIADVEPAPASPGTAPPSCPPGARPDGPPPWDPDVYARVYQRLLRHRRVELVAMGTRLPTARLSVYDFAAPPPDLVPEPGEAAAIIREAEARWADLDALRVEVARWWT